MHSEFQKQRIREKKKKNQPATEEVLEEENYNNLHRISLASQEKRACVEKKGKSNETLVCLRPLL